MFLLLSSMTADLCCWLLVRDLRVLFKTTFPSLCSSTVPQSTLPLLPSSSSWFLCSLSVLIWTWVVWTCVLCLCACVRVDFDNPQSWYCSLQGALIIARHENAVMSTGQTAGLTESCSDQFGCGILYSSAIWSWTLCKFEMKFSKYYLLFITLFSVPAVFLFYLKTSSFPVLFVFEGE